MMRRTIAAILTLCILAGALAGCAGDRQALPAAEAETVTVTDHNGNTVTLPKRIDRIAAQYTEFSGEEAG